MKMILTVLVITATAAGTAFGCYITRSRQYETVFFPHTVINGIDASHKTAEEVKKMIAEGIRDYQLRIQTRNGGAAVITGEEIRLESVFDGSLEEYLDAQEPMRWWQYRSQKTEYEIGTMIVFDEAALGRKLDSLACFSEEQMLEPKNAYVADYQPDQGYRIVPEELGTLLDRELAEQVIVDAVRNLRTELSLEEAGVYVEPEVTSEDAALTALADELNRYVGVTVTYQFGDEREVLDGEKISQWLSVGEDGKVLLDEAQVELYVKQLGSRYDTAYKKKDFQTSYGKQIRVSPSIYGWRINRSRETTALCEILRSGESQTREPIYSQTANSRGENDYGDTYVEINLTAQRLFFYKNGKRIVETDFVSGSQAKGYDTPAGAYPLTYKERNATLRGEDYETPVSYWMPFNGNIGMHDADWRSAFGGQIYKTNGSHGCINLPPEAAKKIFEHISAGDPVICYHLEGTENGAASEGAEGDNVTVTEPPAAEQITLEQTTEEQTEETSLATDMESPAPGNDVPETMAGYGPGYPGSYETSGGSSEHEVPTKEIGPGIS